MATTFGPFGPEEYGRKTLEFQRERNEGDLVRGCLLLPGGPGLEVIEPGEATGFRLMPTGLLYARIEERASGGLWLRVYWFDPDGLDDHGFHVGNTLQDTRGGPLVGLHLTEKGVGESRRAFARLLEVVGQGEGLPYPYLGAIVRLAVVDKRG